MCLLVQNVLSVCFLVVLKVIKAAHFKEVAARHVKMTTQLSKHMNQLFLTLIKMNPHLFDIPFNMRIRTTTTGNRTNMHMLYLHKYTIFFSSNNLTFIYLCAAFGSSRCIFNRFFHHHPSVMAPHFQEGKAPRTFVTFFLGKKTPGRHQCSTSSGWGFIERP